MKFFSLVKFSDTATTSCHYIFLSQTKQETFEAIICCIKILIIFRQLTTAQEHGIHQRAYVWANCNLDKTYPAQKLMVCKRRCWRPCSAAKEFDYLALVPLSQHAMQLHPKPELKDIILEICYFYKKWFMILSGSKACFATV